MTDLTTKLSLILLLASVCPGAQAYHQQGVIDFCLQTGPVSPLNGDKQQQVHAIRQQIDWARSMVDNDRHASDSYRHQLQDQWQSEQIRQGFEQRRECFERWRENMEHIRAGIESQPEAYY